MIFEHKYEVVVKDLGKSNKVSNKAILGYMEEIASLHSSTVGQGVDDLEKNGTAWVILDWKVKVLNRCGYGENVTAKTWVRENNKFYSYRDYEIYDSKNNLIAVGTSKWVLIDIKTKHITKIDDELGKKYKTEYNKNVFNEEKLEKIKEPIEYVSNIIYTVKRSDIDINKHVHNLNYLDFAYETLPKEIYEKEELKNVRINYKHELKYGDTVKCLYSNENGRCVVAIKNEDETKLYAIVELK